MNATTALPEQITAFAAAVRAALSDLPAEEVDELTDGLEADLAEAYAEDLARELPDPVSYAAELRGAAGLPTPVRKQGPFARLVTQAGTLAADVHASLRSNPATAAAVDFLATLRPAWWVVRGWAAYQVASAFFGFEGDLLPASGLRWLMLLVLVAGSVLLGLRTWPMWVRSLIGVGNAIAVIATITALEQVPTHAEVSQAWVDSAMTYENDEVENVGGAGAGVHLNGDEVTNIFAYDARGRALSGVQLFDQDGRPLATSVPGGNGCLEKGAETDECLKPGAWVPTVLETGAQAWDVYPMQMAESTFDEPTTPIEGAVAQDRPAPFLQVPSLFSAVREDAAAAKRAADEAAGKKSGRKADKSR